MKQTFYLLLSLISQYFAPRHVIGRVKTGHRGLNTATVAAASKKTPRRVPARSTGRQYCHTN